MNAFRLPISKLFSGASLTGEDLAALLLIMAMIASLAHLLTMLVTRWGDRYTAIKSLFASVLVHCVCILGVEVFEPSEFRRIRERTAPPVVPETVAQVLLESDVSVELPQAGNTPVADRATRQDIDLERLEFSSPELTASDLPERIVDELESLSTQARDISRIEEREMAELALPSDSGETGTRQVAAEDISADLKTTFEKNNADIAAARLERLPPQQGRPEEDRRAVDPTMLMAAPEIRFDAAQNDANVSLATREDSTISLPSPDISPSDKVESRSAPTPSESFSDGNSLVMKRPDLPSGAAVTFQSRLPRPSRSTPDRSPAERPSRQMPDRARTLTPLNSSYDDVRTGDIAPNFSESLSSAAANLEAELPTVKRRENPPAAYQLRNLASRRDVAMKFGGTRESENAVERSLRWLAANQSADGRWDAEDFGAGRVQFDENGVDRNFAGREADTGLTALVILSFLGAGYTHEDGKYAVEVDKALHWLIQQQERDGNLCGKAEHFARMYCHAMATYALAEAYGMQADTVLGPIVDPVLVRTPGDSALLASTMYAAGAISQPLLFVTSIDVKRRQIEADRIASSMRRVDDLALRSALSRAVTFTIGRQDPRSGGWRYRQLQEGDVSMFGWQMMSLKSAEIAGVSVPVRVKRRMDEFLNSVRQGKDGGLFGYRRNVPKDGVDSEPVTPTMTAEALFCQQMLGYPHESASNLESVAYLMRNTPRLSELNYYYWYYGTLAMYQHGGRAWEDWNGTVREVLISQQIKTGKNAGSWDPSDPWGRYGGRLYSTALATLTLEVYYRFLPLYRMNEATEIEIKLD